MSVHPNRTGGHDVRYRDPSGAHRSKTFRRKRDAERFDQRVKDAKQLGGLAQFDGGQVTLDGYVESTWAPIHAAALAPKTIRLYTGLYDNHISPTLGGYQLRELTAETIGRWQADRLAAGAPVESTRKALTLLGNILQRAVEGGRLASNQQRLVRKAAAEPKDEVRPLAPATVEAIRHALLDGAGRPERRGGWGALAARDAVLVSLLAYSGIRPQEARGLLWRHVQAHTLIVHAPKTRRRRPKPRTVRLLGPLREDLLEWRMASGRPGDDEHVIQARSGGAWSENAFQRWRGTVWAASLEHVGVDYQRPYDLRHSFASLLLHEGRSVIYVARQLGHGAQLTLDDYGHVLDELEDQPQVPAEQAIAEARRGSDVRKLFGRGG
jgi:integrase